MNARPKISFRSVRKQVPVPKNEPQLREWGCHVCSGHKSMEQWRNDGYREKYKEIRMKSCPIDISCTTNISYNHTKTNPRLQGEKLVSNHLYGMFGGTNF